MKFPWIEIIIISFKSVEMKMYIVLKKYLQSFRLLIKFVESSKKKTLSIELRVINLKRASINCFVISS